MAGALIVPLAVLSLFIADAFSVLSPAVATAVPTRNTDSSLESARHNLSASKRDTESRGHGGQDPPARVVRVGLYQNPPKIFSDQQGNPSGIFPGILAEIARAEGWRLEYVRCTWQECLEALSGGRIDLMPDVAYSREREKQFDFHSIPALESWSQVYARHGHAISRLADLTEKRVALLRGAVQFDVFESLVRGLGYDEVTLIPVESYEEAFQLVREGKADAVVANHFVGDYFSASHPLVKTPIVFHPASLYFATARGRCTDLLEAIDRHLKNWKSDPGSPYYRVLSLWMERPPRPLIPRKLIWGLVVTLTALLLTAGLAVLLEIRVRIRTRHLAQANAALRAAEQELRQLNERLEERVRQRTAELEAANRELEAFSYSVSHDLRAPLRVIDGLTQALQEDHGAALPCEAQKLCAGIRDGVGRMNRLISDLLEFSRLSRVPLTRTQVDMNALVKSVLDELLSPTERSRVNIEIGELPLAQGDPSLLRQVWTNLLANALKFSAPRYEPRICVTGERTEREVIYSVRDNGVGFDMRYANSLFSVFRRLHPENLFPGTGVGLALVQRIIHRHGGRVWAQGEVDRGATFFFSLPADHT